MLVNVCLYYNPDAKPYSYSASAYDYMTDPDLLEVLQMFIRLRLVDPNVVPEKIMESHAKVGLMEKLLKYNKRRDTF